MENRKWNLSSRDEHLKSGNLHNLQKASGYRTPESYFSPMTQFFREMDRMFDNAFQNFGVPALMGNMAQMQSSMFNPHIDIVSTENEYIIKVEIAGIEEKDIHLEVSHDGILTISGEKRLDNQDKNRNYHLRERSYGSFERVVALPEYVDKKSIAAEFENSILTITGQKQESAELKPRRIEINAGENRSSNRHAGKQESPRSEARNENASNATHPKRVA